MVSRSTLCHGLHVASALTALVFVLGSFLLHHGRKRHPGSAVLRRRLLRTAAVALVSLSFAAETALVAMRGAGEVQDRIISAALLAFAWAAISLRRAFLVAEVVGLSLTTLVFGVPLLALDAARLAEQPELELPAVESVRVLVAAGLLLDAGLRLFLRRPRAKEEEAGPLLDAARASYGTGPRAARPGDDDVSCSSDPGSGDASDSDSQDAPGDSRTGRLRKSGSWIAYVGHFRIFIPYLIPRRNPKVQACLAVCVLCMVGDRFFNILIPRQIGIVADKLVAGEAPFADLAVYLGLSLLSGDAGLDMVGALAKIPVEQFSYRQLTNAAFSHVMRLSMDFHADRDSAEVMKAIEQGEALTRVLETAVLEMAPTVVDLLVAFVFLYVKFSPAVALCMVTAAMAFVVLEVVTSGWNIANRRRVTRAERDEARVMHQAVEGWQTVSVFNMVSHERFRFGRAVDRQLAARKSWARRDALIQAMLQALVPVTFFLLAGLVIHQVYRRRASPGDFVFLVQYWDYLIMPIKYLSHQYRWLMSDLIDAERLLDLLTTPPSVADKEGAPALGPVEGRVDFDHVDFSYDARRMAIRDVSFTVAPGETVAFVGSTGAGKSSLARLLMRFYDVTSGSVRVDGHDVRDVTQGSLRDLLGVVPQDPLLFNASIVDNIRYARPSASDDDVFDACRAAAIHDKILAFADGYNTNVGEQGVKLSGGEVQRLAIARVFLKDPPILILDEATSAVDTDTEAEIQGALTRLTRKRTTFVIAHRLSTVTGADQILVLHDGSIVERGSHNELLHRRGRYYSMWQKQLHGSQDDNRP